MKILVPTDFSDNAMKAALYAAELAIQADAQIYLLNALEVGYEKIRQPFPVHEEYDKLVIDSRRNNIESTREAILSSYNKVSIESRLVEGLPVESILEFAGTEHVDLIVMGTSGAGKIKEALVGTVAAAVAARSTVPVLIVPAEYQIEKPDGIVFTTNHFEKDAKILDILVKISRIFRATIHAVVFVDKKIADAGEYLEKGRKLDNYLNFLRKRYEDINFTGELIEGIDFESAIALYHAKHQTDISAMISYPKELWERLLHKSMTKKMIYHSHIPVLAMPSSDKIANKQA